jgi:hypothetical protein
VEEFSVVYEGEPIHVTASVGLVVAGAGMMADYDK